MSISQPLYNSDEDNETPFPPLPEIADVLNRSGKKQERKLSKRVVNRLERLAHSGDDVDLHVIIRNGRVTRIGHTPWYTVTSQED
jgi:hypothetical protein